MDYETDDVLANTSEELIVSLRHENNLQQDIIKGLKDQADQDKKQLTLLLMTVNNMSMMHVTCNMRLKVANRQARYIYEMLESFPIVKNMINSTDALSGSQVEERLETLIAQWSQATWISYRMGLMDRTTGQDLFLVSQILKDILTRPRTTSNHKWLNFKQNSLLLSEHFKMALFSWDLIQCFPRRCTPI